MNSLSRTKNLYIVTLVFLIIGVVTTHFIDATYYGHKLNQANSASQYFLHQSEEANNDFRTLLSLSRLSQINCTSFANSYDHAQCLLEVQGPQSIGVPSGQ